MASSEEEPDVSPTGDGDAQEPPGDDNGPFEVRVLAAAKRDLKGLDKQALRKQIAPRLRKLAEDPYQHPTAELTGDLAGLRKWRTGNYRIVYKVADDKPVVLVVGVRHRSTIYEAVEGRTDTVAEFIRSLEP